MRALLDILFPPRETERAVRALTEDALFERLAPTPVEHCPNTTSLFRYRDPVVESLIIEAKFNSNRKAQSLLGRVTGDFLTDWHAEQEVFEMRSLVLVPVPLSRQRARERGYNQVERVLKHTEPTFMTEPLLRRVRETKPQTSLSKAERVLNMNGAFAATCPLDADTIYIVVDDVVTTGATMRSAIEALRTAGAVRVYGLSFAH